MASGNGAYILHQELSRYLDYYDVASINPLYGIFPPAQVLIRQAADIVHGVPDAGGFIAGKHSALVLTFHNYYLDIENMPFASNKQKMFYRFILAPAVNHALKKAAYTVAVSEYTANLVRHHLGFSPVNVILNGVDESLFSPSSSDNHKFTLIFSGNPIARKGIGFLMDIAQQLPDDVILQCTGGLRDVDASLSEQCITWLPSVPYEQMPQLYGQADALFLPSYREGLCLAVLEAMSCGLPVITCNSSSMPELIDHGKGGFLFEPGDIKQALRYIRQLSQNRSQVFEMGRYNREKILNSFRLSRMVRDYDEVFKEVYRRG